MECVFSNKDDAIARAREMVRAGAAHVAVVSCPENGGYGGALRYHVEYTDSPFLRSFETVVFQHKESRS